MSLFGEYLKLVRERASLSQEALAEIANISSAYVSQLETGRRNPPMPDVLRRMAGPLNVPFTVLLVQAGHLAERDLQELLLRGVRRLFAQGEGYEALDQMLRRALDRWMAMKEKERRDALDGANVEHVSELILAALLQGQTDLLFSELFQPDESIDES